jgi:primosomal protein N'
MFVTQVIPLKRGIGIDSLSYFSSERYALGTLLQIPVRSSSILGLVIEVNEVSAAKTALRRATFSLRKLPVQKNVQALTSGFIKTAEELSVFYGTHLGNILYNLLPPEIQRGDIQLPHTLSVPATGEIPLPQLLQAKKDERYGAYRSLVRETFAHAGSILIVAPTSVEAEDLRTSLSLGIEDRVILLTSTIPKRELKNAYTALEDFSHQKLIIATPSHAMIERHDITLTIVEEARSPHYKERVRPYLDYRDVLRIHARISGRRFIMSDMLPRTEDEHARREDVFLTYGETPRRIELRGKIEIVELPERVTPETPFCVFSEEMIGMLREVKKKKSHVFIFSARRGLAPIVTCQDCGHVFRSPESGAPYALVRTMKNGVEERWFVCNTSGERVRAADTCPACGSWKLRERGIGIQSTHDELRKILPQTPIILFDHTTATTYKKARFLQETFYSTKGAIMLGTHMAIPYLTKEIENSLVVNMDALLTTPTWRLEEENLALLLRLREVTKSSVFIQTRSREHELLSYARYAEVERFYTDELALRKSFNYPPFARFIHLTWQAPQDEAKKIEVEVQKLLEHFAISIYQSPRAPKGTVIAHGLVRIPESSWPHPALIAALKALPPTVRIVMNPDRIV